MPRRRCSSGVRATSASRSATRPPTRNGMPHAEKLVREPRSNATSWKADLLPAVTSLVHEGLRGAPSHPDVAEPRIEVRERARGQVVVVVGELLFGQTITHDLGNTDLAQHLGGIDDGAPND